jgi:serine/threonine protein kinase
MAPEILVHRNEYTKSVDIWATGIIMHEIITGGKHPLFILK